MTEPVDGDTPPDDDRRRLAPPLPAGWRWGFPTFLVVALVWAVVLLSLYTDDVSLGGPHHHAWVEFYAIHQRWGFSERSMSDPFARNLLGLTILRHPRQRSKRVLFVHQEG